MSGEDETQEQHEEQVERSPDSPDSEAGPAVDPVETDPGEGEGFNDRSGESAPQDAGSPGFDPDAPVRTSPPPPEAQSGVPQPTDGSNEGVEPQPEFAGPQDAAQGEPGHAEASASDGDDE